MAIILPRRKLLLGAGASLITSPAIIRNAKADLLLTGAGVHVPAGGGGASPSFAVMAKPTMQDNGYGSGPNTFSSISISGSAGDHIIVAMTVSYGLASFTAIEIDVGGGYTAMTQLAVKFPGGEGTGLYGYVLPGAAATCNVKVSIGSSRYIGIVVAKKTGYSTTLASGAGAPVDFYSVGTPEPLSFPSITVPASGLGIALIGAAGAAGTSPITWSGGATALDESTVLTENGIYLATVATGPQTVTYQSGTGNAFGYGATYGVVVAYGP